MAWRIHDNVIRGEVDNRERGVIRGRIWVAGLPGPVELKLKGNAMADLAGCLLTFENPGKTIPMLADHGFAPVQEGAIGDLTASRKVRVFDMPIAEAYMRLKKKLPVPEHLANCLYLEWFSEANGRVVVESTEYKLTVSTPMWRLTPEDETRRAQNAEQELTGFMNRLGEALAAEQEQKAEQEWPESDQPEPDAHNLSAGDSTANGSLETGEAAELEPDPLTEGVDWVRCDDGDITHPLSKRALEGCLALMDKYKALGLMDTEDEALANLLGEYQTASAKLAGALDVLAYGRVLSERPLVASSMKRALKHLEAAQAALAKVNAGKRLPAELCQSTRDELSALCHEARRLIEEFGRAS